MLPSSSAEDAHGDSAPPPFQLPRKRGRSVPSAFDLFLPPVSVDPNDEFWAGRPYMPHAHEASLVTFGLGLSGLAVLGLAVWAHAFLFCTVPFGITSILAGAITTFHPYSNPWWRIPPVLTLVFGLIDIFVTAALLNGAT
jgi:hypothetical protein